MKVGHALSAALTLTAVSAAHANLLVNGSLETTARLNSHGRVLVPTEAPTALGSSWAITQGTVDLKPTSYWQSSNGRFSVDLIGTPGLGGISQTVAGLTIGNDYELTFDFSVNPDPREKGSTKILQVQAVGVGSESQTYQRTVTNESKGKMHYTHETFQFTADATSMTIILSALAPLNLPVGVTSATSVCGPVIDNLDLHALGSGTPNIPEPASMGILGAGSLLLLRRRRV